MRERTVRPRYIKPGDQIIVRDSTGPTAESLWVTVKSVTPYGITPRPRLSGRGFVFTGYRVETDAPDHFKWRWARSLEYYGDEWAEVWRS